MTSYFVSLVTVILLPSSPHPRKHHPVRLAPVCLGKGLFLYSFTFIYSFTMEKVFFFHSFFKQGTAEMPLWEEGEGLNPPKIPVVLKIAKNRLFPLTLTHPSQTTNHPSLLCSKQSQFVSRVTLGDTGRDSPALLQGCWGGRGHWAVSAGSGEQRGERPHPLLAFPGVFFGAQPCHWGCLHLQGPPPLGPSGKWDLVCVHSHPTGFWVALA